MSNTYNRVHAHIMSQLQIQNQNTKLHNMHISAVMMCYLDFVCEMINDAMDNKMMMLESI